MHKNVLILQQKTRTDFLNEVVKLLVERRKELKLTQEQLNYRLNVADRLVNKWECGTRTPTSFNLYCWANALGGRIVFIKDEKSVNYHTLAIKTSNDNQQTLSPNP